MSFTTTKQHSLSYFIFEHLRDCIYRGEISIGARIGAEEEIAESLQVSCHHVNKAISLLIDNGYVERREGLGHVARLPESNDGRASFPYMLLPRTSSLDELLEVRIGLESYGVMLAVERADARDIAFLQQALDELTAEPQSKESARDADIKFHMGIAFATHNSVYVDLVRRFYECMFHSVNVLHELLYEQSRNLGIIDQHHSKILDAISGRDKDAAQRYMMQHIVFLRSYISDRDVAE